ncbi:MAG: zf-HC2 domain-containing protein [Pseudomonadota bacterium]
MIPTNASSGKAPNCPHETCIGEQLSGYLDGELTQAARQRVELRMAECDECRRLHDELSALRLQLGEGIGREFGNDRFREQFESASNRTLATLGWIAMIGGFIALGILIVAGFVADDSVSAGVKWLIALPYAGFGLLFVAVLRRRLRESRTDKYNDVEI